MKIPEVKQLINNEMSVLTSIPKNPFIVHLIETFYEGGYFYMVYEYCEGGNVQEKLKQKKFTEMEALYILRDVVHGVSFLHNNNIIHRDLKSENILFSSNTV